MDKLFILGIALMILSAPTLVYAYYCGYDISRKLGWIVLIISILMFFSGVWFVSANLLISLGVTLVGISIIGFVVSITLVLSQEMQWGGNAFLISLILLVGGAWLAIENIINTVG